MLFVRKHKKKFNIATILIFLLLFGFFLDQIIINSGKLNNDYGVNIVTLVWLFAGFEILFNFGIVLMLWGSGVFRVRWDEIRRFNFEKIKFTGNIVYIGFLINRLSALIPWTYVLFKGWGKLPSYLILAICFEILIVLVIGASIKIPRSKQTYYGK